MALSPSMEAARETRQFNYFDDFVEELIKFFRSESGAEEVRATALAVDGVRVRASPLSSRNTNLADDIEGRLERLRVGDESEWLRLLYQVWQWKPRLDRYYRLQDVSPFASEVLVFIDRHTNLDQLGGLERFIRPLVGNLPAVLRLRRIADANAQMVFFE